MTPPPLPRSGQVNVKISRQVTIFGVILPFYIGQKWVKFFTNRSGQPDRFFPVFFDAFPYCGCGCGHPEQTSGLIMDLHSFFATMLRATNRKAELQGKKDHLWGGVGAERGIPTLLQEGCPHLVQILFRYQLAVWRVVQQSDL